MASGKAGMNIGPNNAVKKPGRLISKILMIIASQSGVDLGVATFADSVLSYITSSMTLFLSMTY